MDDLMAHSEGEESEEEGEAGDGDGEEIDYAEELALKQSQLLSLLSSRTNGLQADDEKARRPIELTVLPSYKRAAPKPCSPRHP